MLVKMERERERERERDSVACVTGKDPLLDNLDGKDINSVAGVLKLYFRELRDPLLPFHMFDDLMACSSNCNFNSEYSSSL